MGKCLVRLERNGEERFVEWSTIVDAPVTYGMTELELRQFFKRRDGRDALERLPFRIERARTNGHSMNDYPPGLADFVSGNRAGEGEAELTVDQLWDKYCEPEPES